VFFIRPSALAKEALINAKYLVWILRVATCLRFGKTHGLPPSGHANSRCNARPPSLNAPGKHERGHFAPRAGRATPAVCRDRLHATDVPNRTPDGSQFGSEWTIAKRITELLGHEAFRWILQFCSSHTSSVPNSWATTIHVMGTSAARTAPGIGQRTHSHDGKVPSSRGRACCDDKVVLLRDWRCGTSWDRRGRFWHDRQRLAQSRRT
jgi:hypothetical protein